MTLNPSWIGPFKTQNDAFYAIDFQNQLGNTLVCWSKEVGNNGARVYYGATYYAFWNKYNKLPPKQRCFYEVIREGKLSKLYFDIEYQIEYNKHTNPIQIMQVYYIYHHIYISYPIFKYINIIFTFPYIFSY